jgi:CheY-like chemotaxis protein
MEEDAEAPAATVLVAEDDPDIRDLFTMALESAGAAVVAVNSGAAALEALQRQKFDLLVTDNVDAQRVGPGPVQGGAGRPGDGGTADRHAQRVQARIAGVTEYLSKPIRPSVLVGKVDALLGGRLVTRSP